jgi:hypothetical protein
VTTLRVKEVRPMTATSTEHLARPRVVTVANVSEAPSVQAHLQWFALGTALAFLVPYIFTSLLDVQHDLYYLLYFASVLSFVWAYVTALGVSWRRLLVRSLRWSLVLGVPATAFVVVNVLSRESTPGPHGFYALFEAGWRGLAYGAVDALLLTVFPGLVAMAVVGGRLNSLARRMAFAATALALTMAITGAYHLGYEQFREDGVTGPEIGNTIISLPLALTGNPLGSVLAHGSMHLAADIHSYETNLFLPPQTEAPD